MISDSAPSVSDDKNSVSMFDVRDSRSPPDEAGNNNSEILFIVDDDDDDDGGGGDSDIEIDQVVSNPNQHERDELRALKNLFAKLDIDTELFHASANLSVRMCTAALFYSKLPETHVIVVNHSLNALPECVAKRQLYLNTIDPSLSIPIRARIYHRCLSLFGFVLEQPCPIKNGNRYLIIYDNYTANYQSPSTFYPCLCQDFDRHMANIDYAELQAYYRHAFRPRDQVKRCSFAVGMIIRVRKFGVHYHNARIVERDHALIKVCFFERKSRTEMWLHGNASIIESTAEYSPASKRRTPSSSSSPPLSSSQSHHSITDLIISNCDLTRLRKRKTNVDRIHQGTKRLRERSHEAHSSITQRQSSSSSDDAPAASRANMLTAYYTDILLPRFRRLNDIPYDPHKCTAQCVLTAEEHFRPRQLHCNPYLIPFECQWSIVDGKPRGYRTPCHRTLYSLDDIEKYLARTTSKLSIKFFVDDLLTRFTPSLNTFEKKFVILDDLSNGLENVPIAVYNDTNDHKPDNFTYITEIRPFDSRISAALNDTNTTSCCNCTDNCSDRMKCACFRKTLDQALLNHDPFVMEKQRNRHALSSIIKSVGYQKKRLLQPVSSGIYECNSKCSCHVQHCSNRVAQQGLFVQLQLFQEKHKGWGLRALHDIPRGTFICQYIGELITSDQGHERAQTIDDRYQTSLDLVKQIRYETNNDEGIDDDDDDGEEPYVIDGSLYSNLGKYFNHSCDPNMYIQNVFIESHDLHFPNLALFTGTRVKAGEELTWHYNCELLPDREVKCFCGSKNCRGRLF